MADEPNPDASEDTEPPDPETSDDTPEEPDGSDLGDAGKKALDSERKARRDAEKRLRQLEADLAEQRKQSLTDDERKLEEARDAGRKEASQRAIGRMFQAELRAAGAGKLANPNLIAKPHAALELLELDEIPVNGDGDIDTEAISDAIDDLLKREPYLAATPATKKANGDANQGPQGGSEPTLDQRLEEAKKKGDTRAYIALQNSRLAEVAKNT